MLFFLKTYYSQLGWSRAWGWRLPERSRKNRNTEIGKKCWSRRIVVCLRDGVGEGKKTGCKVRGGWSLPCGVTQRGSWHLCQEFLFYSRLVGFTSKMYKLLNDKSQGFLMFTVTLMFSERNKKAFASDFGTRKLCAAVAVFFPVNQGALWLLSHFSRSICLTFW